MSRPVRPWGREDDAAIAVTRLLDAAGRRFAAAGVDATGMGEIAAEAGCSRATLYRYFPTRDELHRAFVNREALRLAGELARRLRGVSDPSARLVGGMVGAIAAVRDDPALAPWFAPGAAKGPAQAVASDAVAAIAAGFTGDADAARWVVRVITSFLATPGHDPDDEQAQIERFVAPVLVRASA